MTKLYSIPATSLKAALYCAAKQDVRFYLNGVLLQPEKARLVSTDGHILFCGEAPHGDFPEIIVPRATIEAAFKALGKKNVERTNVEFLSPDDAGVESFRLVTITGTFPFTPIDGRFPEYERVIPATVKPHEVAQFDPDLLGRGRDALATYSGKWAHRGFPLTHNGGNAAIMSEQGINAMVIVMPFRAGEPSDNVWYWGKPKGKVKAA